MKIKLLLNNNYLIGVLLFDLLFLPRLLPIFGIPASLLIVFAYIYKNGLSRTKLLMIIGLTLIGFISVLNGIFVKDILMYTEDIKRVFQLATTLLFGALLLQVNDRNLWSMLIILRIFFVWVFLSSLIFLIAPELYVSINTIMYPEATPTLEENINAYRFNYFFSDPNSAAYFLCFALCLYIKCEENIFALIFTLIITCIVILLTQSRGGYIGFICIFIYLIMKNGVFKNKLILLGVLIIVLPIIYLTFFDFFWDLFKLYELRVATEEALGTGLGGGRFEKYDYFISNINLLPFGVGYSLFRDGFEFRPHSDLIRINFSYGYVWFAAFLFFIIPRRKSSFLLFVVFCIPFLINTVIDDYKLFPLYLIILNLLQSIDKFNKREIL
jgi:hypothetical protein